MDKGYYRLVPYRFFLDAAADRCKLEKLINLFPEMKSVIEIGERDLPFDSTRLVSSRVFQEQQFIPNDRSNVTRLSAVVGLGRSRRHDARLSRSVPFVFGSGDDRRLSF